MILMLASQASATPEVTPAFTSGPSATSQRPGTCIGGSLSVAAGVTISWSASNFNSSLHTYKIYQDGVLVTSQTFSPYVKSVDGYVENGFYNQVTLSWLFRVDIVRNSDAAVLASGSVTWTKTYGTCS